MSVLLFFMLLLQLTIYRTDGLLCSWNFITDFVALRIDNGGVEGTIKKWAGG